MICDILNEGEKELECRKVIFDAIDEALKKSDEILNKLLLKTETKKEDNEIR